MLSAATAGLLSFVSDRRTGLPAGAAALGALCGGTIALAGLSGLFLCLSLLGGALILYDFRIGVVLLILTMIMGFTGYLLPFDQRSFWATVVGNNINGTGPFLGPYLTDFLYGGPEFGATTLSRFYAIHMLIVPGLIIALIGAHLFLVVKLGTTAPPWLEPKRSRAIVKEEKV